MGKAFGNSSYARTFQLLGAVYILMSLAFFFFPSELIYLVNVGPRVFRITEAIPEPLDHIWNIMASCVCATLAGMSFLAAENPKVRGYALVQLLSKAVSAAGFIYYFARSEPYFVYAVGAVIDSLIFVVVLWRLLMPGTTPAEQPKAAPV